ncbi:MAG TPA: bifunctional 5,10-methylenetetrahydrofolate dehydrogenase/5,10-methenyltetrahydrofolate cyclohydrolase [Thermoanaerobaculia bacterium]|nr:bifunctional 5,10-methylenetetrahydrofolate dehydrogenase/5,10-methenyltetrahydrofolate cyclohydrolase [Thermoanaerobaculia bacterium]
MPARIIDGKAIARTVERELQPRIAALAARGIRPKLTAVRVGDDPASEIYVRSKARKAEELGLAGEVLHLPASTAGEELLREVDRLNRDPEIDGILVQLPLPARIDERAVVEAIDPAKDVDGFHPVNVGRLQLGRPSLVPCTPAGVMRLIESTGRTIAGAHAVVVGRSNIVGKPVAILLLQHHATVTICHSRTRDLAAMVRQADIVVAAVGRPCLIRAEMLRPGGVIIDVGMNRLEAGDSAAAALGPRKRAILEEKGSVLVGDVELEGAAEVAGWITPVPGGVGPMTIAMLMANTVAAAEGRWR